MASRTPSPSHPRSHRRPAARVSADPHRAGRRRSREHLVSERLAELAGVNAAKVRKDLSYLGSYGTRGVGYEVAYLVYQIRRELGLTHDWPVVIVGAGNLGQALAGYGGFGERGFPVAGIVDIDRPRSARCSAACASATSTSCRRSCRPSASASASSPRPPVAAQDAADRLVRAGVTSILNFAPVVLAVPRAIEVRKVDLAVELQILSYHEQRRAGGALHAVGNAATRAQRERVRSSRHVHRRHRRQPSHRSAGVARAARRSPRCACPRPSPAWSVAHNIREAVVLSTCNRTEVYAVAERFHGAYADIRDFFCELGGLAPDELHPHLYSQHDDAAVAHLFEVAAGLDSAVLGETEILGQVRGAWELGAGRGRRQGHAEPVVPPRGRDRQAGPHRDRRSVAAQRRSATPRSRWPPSDSVRSPAGACSSSAPARWARASPLRSVHAGATDITVTNRTDRTRRPTRRSASAAASCRSTICRARWPTPTCCSPAPAPAASLIDFDLLQSPRAGVDVRHC